MKYEEALEEIRYQEEMRSKGIDYRVSNLVVAKIVEALEKQIPKKPIDDRYPWAICPVCGGSIHLENVQEHIQNKEITYCEHCGQALDWSDTE